MKVVRRGFNVFIYDASSTRGSWLGRSAVYHGTRSNGSAHGCSRGATVLSLECPTIRRRPRPRSGRVQVTRSALTTATAPALRAEAPLADRRPPPAPAAGCRPLTQCPDAFTYEARQQQPSRRLRRRLRGRPRHRSTAPAQPDGLRRCGSAAGAGGDGRSSRRGLVAARPREPRGPASQRPGRIQAHDRTRVRAPAARARGSRRPRWRSSSCSRCSSERSSAPDLEVLRALSPGERRGKGMGSCARATASCFGKRRRAFLEAVDGEGSEDSVAVFAVGARFHTQQRRRARVPAGLRPLLPDRLRRAGERPRPDAHGAKSTHVRPAARPGARDVGRPARGRRRREGALRRRRGVHDRQARRASCRSSSRTRSASTTGSAANRAFDDQVLEAIDRAARARKLGYHVADGDYRPGHASSTRCGSSRTTRISTRCARRRTITAEAHVRAMGATKPGHARVPGRGAAPRDVPQARLGAPRVREHRRLGARTRRILHYRANNRKMESGELLLIDAGCEYDYYASDVTRTFPVSGKFTRSSRRSTSSCSTRRRRASTRRVTGRAARADPHDVRRRDRRAASCGSASSRASVEQLIEDEALQAVLHAPDRVTGSAWTCTTSATYYVGRQAARARAGHGAHRRAGHLHREGRRQGRAEVARHRRADRGRHPRHGRGPDNLTADPEDGGGGPRACA